MSLGEMHGIYTVAFMLVFLVMIVWVFLPRRRGTYQDAAELPFQDQPGASSADSRKDQSRE